MADYEGVLADLRAKRAAIDRERTELDTAITALERLVPPSSNGRSVRPLIQAAVGGLSSRAFTGLTMPEAITKALKMLQQPQTTGQIKATLRAGGVKVGKSFNPHVYNTLKRMTASGAFRRETDGRWSLGEWSSQQNADNPISAASGTH